MTRLSDDKIAYACRQAMRGMGGLSHETPGQMAARWGVTARRIRQVQQQWRQRGIVPKLNPNRRPKGPPLSEDDIRRIEEARTETRRGARKIWLHLRKNGTRIARHKVHAYATRKGWSTPNSRKQRKRKRTRYEREHSGSLLHGDWHLSSDGKTWLIAWIDDASRRILSAGEFPAISGRDSISTFKAAQQEAAKSGTRIIAVNTDRGSEFYANKSSDREPGWSQFELYLHSQGIHHIPSRKGNPQTNGKAERLWLEYDRHRSAFSTLEEWVAWYNRQIHDELWVEMYETPDEAWSRKLPQESMLGLFFRSIGEEGAPTTVEAIYGK